LTCNACQSEKQRFFNSEIAIHLPGLDGLDKPLVFVFAEARGLFGLRLRGIHRYRKGVASA